MVDAIRVQPTGLVTDPSRIVAGQTALTRARNIMCSRPGLVTPRARLAYHISEQGPNDDARYVREWDANYWFAAENGTSTHFYNGTGSTSYRTIAGRNMFVRSELSGGRQFWTFASGIRMLDDSSGLFPVVSRFPGVEIPTVTAATTVPVLGVVLPGIEPIAPMSTIGYRFCTVRYIGPASSPVRSAPSTRIVLANGHATDYAGATFTLTDTVAGDVIEMYRNAISATGITADPGDEMILVGTSVATGSTVTMTDHYVGPAIGAALYTNASQQGPDRANFSVRTAHDVADFKQRLFYAGATAGPRATVTLTQTLQPVTVQQIPITLRSVRSDGTHTIGSPTITGIVTGNGLISVGQIVTGWSSGADRPDPANPADPGNDGLYGRVISVNTGAGTVTLDTNATATGTTARFVAWDWVGIDFAGSPITAPKIFPTFYDVTTEFPNPNADDYGPAVFQVQEALAVVHPSSGAGDMSIAWNGAVSALASPYSRTRLLANGSTTNQGISLTWTYELDTDTGGTFNWATLPAFAVVSSKPLAYSTPLALTYATSSLGSFSEVDGGVADLWWSKTNEPEAVPLGNRVTIGDPTERIARIVATTDRLWVFKTDGLWTVYGDGDLADSLVVQLVDPTLKLFDSANADETQDSRAPQWCVKIRDTVYVWARSGMFAIDSGGPRRIDQAIRTMVQRYTPGFIEAGSVNFPVTDPFAAASPKDGIVAFGMSRAQWQSPSVGAGIAFVLHVESGTWSTWDGCKIGQSQSFPRFAKGNGDSEASEFLMAMHGGYLRYRDAPYLQNVESAASSYPATGDQIVPRTGSTVAIPDIFSVVGTTVTFNPPVVPFVGDWIRDSAGNPFYIVGTGGASVRIVDRTGAATGACLEHITSVDREIGFSVMDPPTTEKHFLDLTIGMQQARGGIDIGMSWRARGKAASTAEMHTWTYDDPAVVGYPKTIAADREYDQKISVPSSTPSRARGLEIVLSSAWANEHFEIDSIAVRFENTSDRIEGRLR